MKKVECRMKKILFFIFVFVGLSMAAAVNRFVDNGIGGGSNNGTSTDNAFQACSLGFVSAFAAADTTFIWFKRTNSQTIAGNITAGGSSTYQNKPIYFLSWPRGSKKGAGTFIQGNSVVFGVSPTPDFTKDGARTVKSFTGEGYYTIAGAATMITLDATTKTAFARYRNVLGVTSGATGKIQRWVDGASDTMWILVTSGTFQADERITSAQGGADTIAAVTENSGYILSSDYSGSTGLDSFTIAADPLFDRSRLIDDAAFTVKLSTWSDDTDSLPAIGFTSTYKITFANFANCIQGFKWVGGGGSNSGVLVCAQSMIRNCMVYSQAASGAFGIHTISGGSLLKNVVLIGPGAATGGALIKNESENSIYENVICYRSPTYGATFNNGAKLFNCSFGVLADNTEQDINSVWGKVIGYNVAVGGRNGTLRTSTYDCWDEYTRIENYQNKYGYHITKISNGFVEQFPVTGATDPVKRTGGADYVCKVTLNESLNYLHITDDHPYTIFERNLFVADTGIDTIKCYVQNNGWGNINSTDSVNKRTFWLEAIYPTEYVNDSVYSMSNAHEELFDVSSTSSANPIPNRGSSSDWDDYLKIIIHTHRAGNVKILLKARSYHATGILYFDPKMTITR